MKPRDLLRMKETPRFSKPLEAHIHLCLKSLWNSLSIFLRSGPRIRSTDAVARLLQGGVQLF